MLSRVDIEVGYWRGRKAIRLQAMFAGAEALAAVAVPPRLWDWAVAGAPDGVLRDMDPAAIAAAAGWPLEDGERLVAALLAAGFLDQGPDGTYRIHNWTEHTGQAVAAYTQRATTRRARRLAGVAGQPRPVSTASAEPLQTVCTAALQTVCRGSAPGRAGPGRAGPGSGEIPSAGTEPVAQEREHAAANPRTSARATAAPPALPAVPCAPPLDGQVGDAPGEDGQARGESPAPPASARKPRERTARNAAPAPGKPNLHARVKALWVRERSAVFPSPDAYVFTQADDSQSGRYLNRPPYRGEDGKANQAELAKLPGRMRAWLEAARADKRQWFAGRGVTLADFWTAPNLPPAGAHPPDHASQEAWRGVKAC